MPTSAVRVFISYSHEDAAVAERIKSALRAAGADVWIDHESLRPGNPNWQLAIREGIEPADFVIYVASPAGARSPYVIDELSLARDVGRRIIPFWADGRSWSDSAPLGLGTTHYIDGRSTRYTAGVAGLLDALGLGFSRQAAGSAPSLAASSVPPTTGSLAAAGSAAFAQSGSSRVEHSDSAPILVADDYADIREVLRALLTDSGYEVVEAGAGQEALDLLTGPEEERPSLALLDISLPDLSGIEILQRLQERGVDIPVIMITGMSASSLAIKAIQLGAADYVQKPLDADDILAAITTALRNEEIKRGAGPKLVPQTKVEPSERIVGSTPDMLRIFKTIAQVARTNATVLVTGDTGTGKELMAEAIHGASDRRSGPLIKVNCAALPKSALESELFGHERSKVTGGGTVVQHKGGFELAHKGTIFLDEIGEMTLGTQKKLLRVLQEKEFERVGGTVPVKVDVRVIAATNRNLREEVAAKRFREDLYYHLNVIAIHVPPLRERLEDLPALVSHFLNKHRYTPASPPARITEEAMEKLRRHDWPGNVRELENTILRAVVLSRGTVITSEAIVFAS